MKKNKYLIFSSIFVSCALAFFGKASAAADTRHPNFPTGGNKCYPGNPSCEGKMPAHNKDNHMMNAPLKMNSVEKFKGTVKSVNRVVYPGGTQLEITLDTNEGIKKVILGPTRYIDQSKVKVQSGDKITVMGFRVTANGDEVIQAAEVDKNGNVLKLRDENRQPMWR